jgi:hypothetical protein
MYPTAKVDRNVLFVDGNLITSGHRGGHRRLPAPGASRAGQRGHQQDRPPVRAPQRDGASGSTSTTDPGPMLEGFAPTD